MRLLAVIDQFRIGIGDYGVPAIWFTTYINEGEAALQTVHGADNIYEFMVKAGLENIMTVEGKYCWVDVGEGMIRFIEFAKEEW